MSGSDSDDTAQRLSEDEGSVEAMLDLETCYSPEAEGAVGNTQSIEGNYSLLGNSLNTTRVTFILMLLYYFM